MFGQCVEKTYSQQFGFNGIENMYVFSDIKSALINNLCFTNYNFFMFTCKEFDDFTLTSLAVNRD